jgi:ATP-dependent Zn protease
VSKLINSKEKELRNLAKELFQHDYLDADQMDRIISGRGLDPNTSKPVREWKSVE